MSFATVPPQLPPRRRVRWRVRWRRLVSLAMVAAGLVGLTVALVRGGGPLGLAASVAGRVLAVMGPHDASSGPPVVRPTDPLTVLVMGVEDAPAYAGPQLTDSMMVLGFDPASRRAQILSVPRDLWVDIPGVGQQRLNAALEDGGPQTAELAVERYIGVPVEHYAVVDYTALVKLVDDVGGIEVDVPYAIDDSCYPNALENACTVYRLSKGAHHMDGQQALMFARERHSYANEDLTREGNQQLVLLALKQALLQPRNLLHLPTIVGDLSHLVTTDLPPADLPQLAAEAVHLPAGSISTTVLGLDDGTVAPYVTSGGADVLVPDEAAIHRAVAGLFAPDLALMRQATVQVENAAPTTQPLATYFSQVLEGMGATTLAAAPAPVADQARNAVYWNPAAAGSAGPPAMAYMLAAMLGTQVRTQAVSGTRAPLVAVLGQAFPKVEP